MRICTSHTPTYHMVGQSMAGLFCAIILCTPRIETTIFGLPMPPGWIQLDVSTTTSDDNFALFGNNGGAVGPRMVKMKN